ncbi:terpene synthase family protein [Nocardia suismassiliense]|uniref:terpene synthase family protein n=1 Tax=Nocardia suismassiliense TaxID=2077092 RepID=UPI00131ED855|nr:terpene synthase family protein [Nocardia suismassiliense]
MTTTYGAARRPRSLRVSAPYPLIGPGTTCYLSQLACGTPSKINPDYPAIYERNAAWVRRFLFFNDPDEMSNFFECRYPLSESMQFPHGMPDRIVHSTCVLSLMFQVEDLAVVQRALFDDIADGGSSDNPYGPAFHDAFGTLRRHMPPAVFRRYRLCWQDWFESAVAENELRDLASIPDVDTYLRIRRVSIGMRPGLVIAEYVHGLDLTSHLEHDPDLVRMGYAAIDHVLLVNDMYSFRKECFDGELVNVLASLMDTRRHSLQESVDIVSQWVRDADRALAALSAMLRLRYRSDPDVLTYIDALHHICSGNLRWSMETARYGGRGYGWNGLRTGRLTLLHDRTIIDAAD